MKNLIIHIGYPKTATTTLQESVFSNLHFNGLINYLGLFNSEVKNFDYAKKLYLNEEEFFGEQYLQKNKMNLLSLEALTVPKFHMTKFPDNTKYFNIDPFVVPEKIKKVFGDKINYKILITLRKQSDLIYSLFVEDYNIFFNSKIVTWDDYFDKLNKKQNKDFLVYQYDKLIDKYTEVFQKKNINILLFEDFIFDRDSFIFDLSQILNIKKQNINKMWLDKNLNNKKKTDDFYVRELYKNYKIIKLLLFLRKKMNKTHINKFERIYYYLKKYIKNNKHLSKIFNKLFKKNHKIKKPSIKQKNIIFESYKDSNLLLTKEYNLDFDKMKKYGYF